MDIRLKTCLIVRRNGEYLVGLNQITGGLNWSTSPYDAWRTRKIRIAQAVAGISGGILCLFNPIAGEIKDI